MFFHRKWIPGLSWLFAAVLLASRSSAATAVPTHVQQCAFSDVTGTSYTNVSCTFPQPTEAGDLVVVDCGWGNSGDATVVAVTDANDRLTEVAHSWDTRHTQGLDLQYLEDVPAGRTSVTCRLSTPSSAVTILAHEYTGIAAVAALDTTASSVGVGTAMNSGAVITTLPDELIFGAALEDSLGDLVVFDAGTGFSLREDLGAVAAAADEDEVLAAAGGVAATFTVSPANQDWICQVAAFRSAGVGSPPSALEVGCGCGAQRTDPPWAAILLSWLLIRRRQAAAGSARRVGGDWRSTSWRDE